VKKMTDTKVRHNNRSYQCEAYLRNGKRCTNRIKRKIGEAETDFCRVHTHYDKMGEEE